MATSGTTIFNPDLSEIFEEAFERLGYDRNGMPFELRTGYDLRTARRSLNLLLAEWANRGINLWTVDSGEIAMVANQATYDLPSDTVDIVEQVIRQYSETQNQTDITINRISVATYSTIPNKLTTGRPIQVYVDRKTTTPTITVWPLPQTSDTYTFVYWRLRRMQDAGSPATNTVDIPFRFYEALIAGVAYRLALKKAPESAPMLKALADEAFDLAAAEDRDRAPIRMVPRYLDYR
mgnify:CR=1 FL=1